jgi:C1A family cysteine protease
MKKGWLGVVISLVLCLALVSSAVAPAAAEGAEEGCDSCQAYPIMHPDQETLERWIEAYNNAPRAYIKMEGFQVPSPRGSLDLLDHLEYIPSQRDQGSCGNCWAWAGTGCLEIALDVQEEVKDRLSVQYVNSCESDVIGKTCCDGGWLSEFADFYNATGECIPWANGNAYWQSGDGSCGPDCSSISTDPNYPITAIQETTIVTQTVNQATAIANIKSVLSQNRAVWFGFFLPNDSAWDNFGTFWANSGEGEVYTIDQFCGEPWVDSGPNKGGGHAVLCVGYNDDDPENEYWIMLNSWGTDSGGRPNGLFRINMDMAYNCTLPGLSHYYDSYAFMWQTLDVTFGAMPDITVFPSSFEVTLPPDTTQDYTLTISNDGDADLSYTISDYETTGFTAPTGVETPVSTQGKEERKLELTGLSPSEPISFAAPAPLRVGAEEIAYDDNEADTGYDWTQAGGEFAVRFTPSSYPVALQTARICLWAGPPEWPDSDHEEFAVKVYDDDGAGGAPGTLLGSVNTTATDWGWWDVDISGLGITVISGDFYIAYRQLSNPPDCEAVCADFDDPDGRSWAYMGYWDLIENWLVPPLDWMIRCVVEEADCPWLGENPTSGTVEPGGSDDITISINTTGLAAGDYSAEIVISNNDPDEDPTMVPVTLHISSGGQPEISVSPTSFNVTLPTNTSHNYTLTISNEGGADLSYSISDRETTGHGSRAAASPPSPSMPSNPDADNVTPLEESHVLPRAEENNGAEQIFEEGDTLEEIRDKIEQNGYNFTVEHNWVYDMSPEEKEQFFSRRDRGFPEDIKVSEDIGPLARQLGRKQLPTSFDWRDYSGHSYIGDIRDQGSCGSCYAFAACAAAEGTYNWATGLYDGSCADFSESFVMWCLGNLPQYSTHFYGCTGADYSYSELTALTVEGICSEADFPYQTEDGCGTHWDDPRVTFGSWYRIPCGDIDAIKTAIMTYGPVDAAVDVTPAFQAYSGGIYQDSHTTCPGSPCYETTTDHAIALVGWDDNGDPDTNGYWILRNSWGSDDWGEDGYMNIKYHSARVACEACYLVYGGEDCLWLSENPTSGSVEPASWDEITVTIDTTGLAEGDYDAEIVIDNNDLNENPTIVPVTLHVRPPATSYDIDLVEGYNLISLPLIPDSSDITDVLAGISGNVTIVWYYDAGTWLWYVPGSPGSTLPAMEDGLGYWIFMNNADTLNVTGKEAPAPPEPSPTYDVVTGWNLIGFKSTVDMAHDTYLASVAGDYLIMWGWEAGEGFFSPYPLNEHGGNMEAGRGYWLWMNIPGTIVPP